MERFWSSAFVTTCAIFVPIFPVEAIPVYIYNMLVQYCVRTVAACEYVMSIICILL